MKVDNSIQNIYCQEKIENGNLVRYHVDGSMFVGVKETIFIFFISLPHIHNYFHLHPCIITITFILSFHTLIETLYFQGTLYKPFVFYLLVFMYIFPARLQTFEYNFYVLLTSAAIDTHQINKCPKTCSIIYYISCNYFQRYSR